VLIALGVHCIVYREYHAQRERRKRAILSAPWLLYPTYPPTGYAIIGGLLIAGAIAGIISVLTGVGA
jgi:hypothetical protein